MGRMRELNCIIVEDEPLAAEVLEDYIQQIPGLSLKATCPDAIYALEILHRQEIDVIFLDIHLPKLKGLDFIKSLRNPPKVILTTAYHQYALEGYDLDVVDYLLKPISFGRFFQAVQKLPQLQPQSSPTPIVSSSLTQPERDFRFFVVNKKRVRVYLDEILYIESLKEYIRIHTIHKSLVTQFQIGEFEQFMDWNNLLRIHRSFIVAKDKIDSYSASEIEIKGNIIPIGRSYKELVIRELSNL